MDRRIWIDEETTKFVGFMEELVMEGQRADNGQFKSGSFNKLAFKMNARFPGNDFKASHCKNKHKRLNEKFQFAQDMMNCSGFGWDDVKQCVVVDSKDVLDNWLKQHGQRLYTPRKPFPLFPRLAKIFERDRVADTMAESGNDMHEEVQKEDEQQIKENDISGSEFPDDIYYFSVASSADKGKGMKPLTTRLSGDGSLLKELIDTVRYAIAESGKQLEQFGEKLTAPPPPKPFGDIIKDLGFSNEEVVMTVLKFTENPQLGSFFWTLCKDQKADYVRAFLRK